MAGAWPDVSYERWRETCDTLHAHTQVIGKVAVALAPPEPQLQHAALRLTARGWETAPLPAPDGTGALTAALDLRAHEAVVEHSDGRTQRIPLVPDRPVGEVARAVLQAVRELGGAAIPINPAPQEVPWSEPLDQDDVHRRYDPEQVRAYFAAATQAAFVLGALRAPFRGRSSPVNAWWGTFDLAVSLFSGRSLQAPGDDFIRRNTMDAEQIEVGWWPGDTRYPRAAFFAFAHPGADGWSGHELAAGRWDETLGEYVLDWDDARASDDPQATALDFARDVVAHACAVCGWDPLLAGSARGTPPPLV
jgi:Family of unknown function (DUF5996)